ncbi:hypothetical protein [Achromobacter sp. DH1f]|uniref:hypothetical protein n=1 Tax=Achromobacter sp. DH1f TaxID=1397275 RepID=UPI000AEBEF26|nr:hypothetical protein [Achromobacter sp. DH1f]
MKPTSKPVSLWECAAFLYLFAPVVVFFATFVRWEIAALAVPLLLSSLVSIIRRTSFEMPAGQGKAAMWYAVLSASCLVIGGAGGFAYIPSDWEKHFSILNLLLQNNWPPTITSAAGDVEVLRYSLGWYLVPALVAKTVGAHNVDLFSAGWSLIGLTIFFSLAASFWPGKKGTIAGPLVFLAFSGMDYIGTQLTGHMAAPHHYEWWPGWMQYSANLTSLFWVPQHAIAGWIAVALLMKQWESPTAINHIGVLLFAVLLWSPFITVGLLPIYLVLAMRHGLRPMALGWWPIASAVVIGLPLVVYLTSGTAALIKGLIWDLPCIGSAPASLCFSPKSYATVMMLEVLPFVVLAWIAERRFRALLAAVAVTLAILPFYRLGLYNDLTMRASAPALAILAILVARTVMSSSPLIALPLAAALMVGAITPFGQLQRAFTEPQTVSSQDQFGNDLLGTYRQQYFAPYRPGIFR